MRETKTILTRIGGRLNAWQVSNPCRARSINSFVQALRRAGSCCGTGSSKVMTERVRSGLWMPCSGFSLSYRVGPATLRMRPRRSDPSVSSCVNRARANLSFRSCRCLGERDDPLRIGAPGEPALGDRGPRGGAQAFTQHRILREPQDGARHRGRSVGVEQKGIHLMGEDLPDVRLIRGS